jgi:hypothetical protein
MRILLDENFPADFATLLAGHQIAAVHSLGWSGIKNGTAVRKLPAPAGRAVQREGGVSALPSGNDAYTIVV